MTKNLNVADLSSVVAERMLQGWVLTDDPCDEPGCNVPLMRSPKGNDPTILFCARCDGPANPPHSVVSSSQSAPSGSRTSTPPTELSSVMSSPVFAPIPTAESMRRRQQSDAASAEIGNRLLKGWAMLADECPNIDCYGVPLVRPPKSGGVNNLTKECVVCGSTYTTAAGGGGLERLVPSREIPNILISFTPSSIANHGPDGPPQISKLAPTLQSKPDSAKPARVNHSQDGPSPPPEPTLSALEASALSLEKTLQTLSERLNVLSSQGPTVDCGSMGSVADAMYRVTLALGQVKQLQWSQTQTSYR